MRIIAIGDLHGRSCWKEIDPALYDRIVFLGDYVDSLVIPAETILKNLEELIEFKVNHFEKVTLLLGNHDVQYSEYPFTYTCSGFNGKYQARYTKLFRDNSALFKVAESIGDYLFTHAGVSVGFMAHNLKKWSEEIWTLEYDIAELLNNIHESDYKEILHTVGKSRGGSDPFGGITWADMSETHNDYLFGYNQVVGHSPVKRFTHYGDIYGSITYIDVKERENIDHFFQIEIN